MRFSVEKQLKLSHLPVSARNVSQYYLGIAIFLPAFLFTGLCAHPLRDLIGPYCSTEIAKLSMWPLFFIVPGILWLLLSRKCPAFARGLRDVMVGLVVCIPIIIAVTELKKLLKMAVLN